ncbi:alpha-tocopherol transfer protein-like [Pectinophora gossypiella]|uniref:alpha-tocopherol transfer protein-like n=1 Tax=Pectinophora gossypiella TaxID=13191 RepID=UPI00214EE870|nr:alpha-tocopherol transfer protein-like [Pectinophora gossypiella]XP_049872145.1 alpha-tocopherol transfer protein-like [Pectinophora gossypiella]
MPDQEIENYKDLVSIKDWLSKQPHLPHDVDELLLRRFLASCHYSLERTKRTIDFFFTLRSTAPELFCKRDPWAPEIRRVFEITDMLPLPGKTKENYKVFIYRLNNPELDLFNFVDAVKAFFMLADTRLTEDDDIPAGEIPIFDSANVTLKFIGKINLSVLRKYMLYTQEAIPIRLKQVHIINAPSYISKIHAICKPFLKAEVAKLIKFHEPNSTTLYKDIPQELLPTEYGGQAGSLEQIKRHWIKRIEAKRDWFLTNDKRWEVDEGLRPTNCRDDRTDKVRDLPGSFRTLALD